MSFGLPPVCNSPTPTSQEPDDDAVPACHRGDRPRRVIRRDPRRRWRRPLRADRLRLRGPRAERRGQDHHGLDRHTLLAPTPARRAGSGPRHRRGGRRGARAHEPHGSARLGGRGPDRAREPDPARTAARPEAVGRQGAPARLLEAFGLADAAGRLVKHYSGGMRRRLDIAASIVVTPDVMFLGEPTTGLDPRSRNQVWDIIRTLVGEGTTILLCTQYLGEADQLADGIAVIDHGKVIAEGTPGQLKASVGLGALRVRLLDPEQRAEAERALAGELESVNLDPDPPRSRLRAPTRTELPRPSPSSAARGCGSPTSRSASRASTKCSSP